MDLRDEESIVLALGAWRDGKPEGFARLYVRLWPVLREIVRVRMGAHLRVAWDSMDVVQEVFVSLASSPPPAAITGAAALIAFLASAIENRLRDFGRYRKRAKRDARRERASDSVRTALREVVAEQSSPREVAMGKEQYERYLAALSRLPEREREAIVQKRQPTSTRWESRCTNCSRCGRPA